MNKKINSLISKVLLPLLLVPSLYFAKPGEVKGKIKEFPQTQQTNITINETETENITIPLTVNIYNQGATKADSTPAKVDTVYKIIKEPVQKDSTSSILELEEMPNVYSAEEGKGSHTIQETPELKPKVKKVKIGREGAREADYQFDGLQSWSAYMEHYNAIDEKNVVGFGGFFNQMIGSNSTFDFKLRIKPDVKIKDTRTTKASIDSKIEGVYKNLIAGAGVYGMIKSGSTGPVDDDHAIIYGILGAGIGEKDGVLNGRIYIGADESLDKVHIGTQVRYFWNIDPIHEFFLEAGREFDGNAYANAKIYFGEKDKTQFGLLIGGNTDEVDMKEVYENDPQLSYFWKGTTVGTGLSIKSNQLGLEGHIFTAGTFTGQDSFEWAGIKTGVKYTLK